MKLGLFTALYADLPLADMLQKVKDMGIEAVELYTGKLGAPSHCDPEILLNSDVRLQEFKDTMERFGLPISQLNCSGNPVSPIPGEAAKHKEGFLQTIRLAEKLGVDTIANFSGCPGGGPKDEPPNWITCPWPEEFLSMLDYQWNDVLIPFWSWAAREAADSADEVRLELHPVSAGTTRRRS
jgi:sugar phosphate isomerase/epimerase